MPPQFPFSHRGMTANPLKPVKRYRPGKALAEEPSTSEEEEEYDIQAEEEERHKQEAQRRRQQQKRAAPKATSFPGTAAGKITTGLQDVKIEEEEEEDEEEEGFVTEEEEETTTKVLRPATAQKVAPAPHAQIEEGSDEEEEEEEEEEGSSEEESSEDEAPQRVLLRPTFIKKDKRKESGGNAANGSAATLVADSAADAESQQAQRQAKADMLVKEQLEKEAIARAAGRKAWDEDEEAAAEEDAIDDRDGLDPEAEYAGWRLRELKRIKREREVIEAAEKEHEEIERRRNLTTEEREREDQEFIAKQKEEHDATRGQTGFMQKYFHKGAFFRNELEREGLDKREIMGARFADDVNRETLPQYMQIRDMTKLGRKGRTKYKDLRSEDTGRWAEGFDNRPRKDRDQTLIGVTDERFLPDSHGDDRRDRGPTGANASAIRDRRRSRPQSQSRPRRRTRSRSFSPRRDRYNRTRDDDRDQRNRSRSRSRSQHRHDDYRRDDDRNQSHRKRSHSPPYGERDKRRRVDDSRSPPRR